jgi:hypothetical protein
MKSNRFIKILPQPDDTTCGPTSLHAVYQFHGMDVSLQEVIQSVDSLPDGGTLAVMLGIDALNKGFKARIFSYNLKMFDPSWEHCSNAELVELLEQQLKYKAGKRFTRATRAYQNFLRMGGEIILHYMHRDVLESYLTKDVPILTGLNATYLYNSKREYTDRKNRSVYHDLKGVPTGHFVVVSGMEQETVFVADPFKENPISGDSYYKVDLNRLINAILLGSMTYDANMLVILPGPDTSNN